MSYIRGEFYTWVSGCDRHHLPSGARTCYEHDRIWIAAVTALPMEVFDALVVMRHAELVEEGLLEENEQRVVEKYGGNFGSYALQKKRGGDPEGDLHRRLSERLGEG